MRQTLTHTYQDIPAGSSCTVTETSNGATTTVTASVAGANQTVMVPAGTLASLSITDTFSPAPGAVNVVKTLTGPGAGSQGLVGILLICSAPIQVFAMVIPAGHPAGPVSQVFNGVGGGSTCLVTEVVDGHTDTLAVKATGASQQVTVPAAGIASVQMTDSFSGSASQPQPPAPQPQPPAPQPQPPASQPQLPATGLSAPVVANDRLCGSCHSCWRSSLAARTSTVLTRRTVDRAPWWEAATCSTPSRWASQLPVAGILARQPRGRSSSTVSSPCRAA